MTGSFPYHVFLFLNDLLGPSELVMILQLQENERKLHRSLQEVKNVEFELEEAASRKKVHEHLFKLALIKKN